MVELREFISIIWPLVEPSEAERKKTSYTEHYGERYGQRYGERYGERYSEHYSEHYSEP